MSTITTILATDKVGDSRADLNTNFGNLNTDKLEAGDDIGTPSAGVLTNCTGTASGLTAGAVTGYTPAGGSLTLGGADALTFNTEGATTLILPTTGTVSSIAGTETLTNKTLTAPVISTISNTGTVTLPTATDTLVGRATTDTLTNKRIDARTNTIASSATPTPAGDTTDIFTITALAAAATVAAPTGTPVNGQVLVIRIKDNATARALTWNAIYRASSDLALPTTTIISKTMYLQFIYNSTDSKWDLAGFLDNF